MTEEEDRWEGLLSELRSTTKETDRLRHETDMAMVKVWRSEMALEIRNRLIRFAPHAIYLESKYDMAIIGLARICRSSGGSVVRIVYDVDRLVQLMIEVDGVSQRHAAEWMAMQSAIDAESAPIFVLAESRI